MYERQNKAMKNIPNRREREEITKLTDQLQKLEEKLKTSEQRNKLTIERLKKQVSEAIEKHEELREERDSVAFTLRGPRKLADDEEQKDDENEQDQDEDQEEEEKISKNNSESNPTHVNFYQPVGDQDNQVDLNNISHSPHFGSRKSEMIQMEMKKHSGYNALAKNSNFDTPPSEEDEEVSEKEEDQSDRDAEEDDDECNSDKYDMKFLDKYHNNRQENRIVVQENIGEYVAFNSLAMVK